MSRQHSPSVSPYLLTAYAKNSETTLVEPFKVMVLRVACASLDILICCLATSHHRWLKVSGALRTSNRCPRMSLRCVPQ